MSKNLDREYRALVDSEAPDLWSRIEAGLEEKSAPDHSAPPGLGSSDHFAPGQEMNGMHITDSATTGWHHNWIPSKKVWAGLAAACVCAALIVPAMTTTMRMGRSGSGNEAPNDTSYDHVVPQAAETYRMAAETGQEETYGNSVHAGADSDTDNVAGLAEEAAEEEQDLHCFDATVEILDTDVRRNSGILYTAKVIATDYPGIAVDSEIKIFCQAIPEEDMTVLENAKTYDLTLRGDGSDEAGVVYDLLEVQ